MNEHRRFAFDERHPYALHGNTAYDVYFHDDPDSAGGGPDVYLMVWLHPNAIRGRFRLRAQSRQMGVPHETVRLPSELMCNSGHGSGDTARGTRPRVTRLQRVQRENFHETKTRRKLLSLDRKLRMNRFLVSTLLLPVAALATSSGCETVSPPNDVGSSDADDDDDDDDDNDDVGDNDDDDANDDDNANEGFGCDITGGGTQSDYFTFDLTICGDDYSVQTNPWGGAEQEIKAGDGDVFEVLTMQEPSGGNPWDVAAFPSVYKGTAQGGNPTPDSGMPIAVSDISSVETGLSTNATSTSYNGNTAYDVYFHDDPDYAGGGPDVYLMVWFHANAINPLNTEGWNCAGTPPTYIDSCTSAGSITIDDKEFVRFIGDNGATDVISYAPIERFDEWEFDLKDFVDDAVDQGLVSPDQYLVSVQAGLELIKGGTGLTIHDFYANIE